MPISSLCRARFWPLLTLSLVALSLGIGGRMQASAPPCLPDAATASEFSAQRALAQVEVIAREPHPAGSKANAEVRDYLLASLRELDAEVELQTQLQTYDLEKRAGQTRFARIENVVARLPGRHPGPSLLLMAHYDSVPNAPGAGDDASGVATLLETFRVLAASGRPLRNDLVVLFTDGEEIGLFGAQAFFAHHRWASGVGLVLNFDARGSKGPVYMFDTSAHNGALIDALAEAVAQPYANSLVRAIFQKMPNISDFSVPMAAGIPAMNFAFINGFAEYHSQTDTASRLSLDSLQHMGNYALPLIRYFGDANLPPAALPDRHYFNLWGHLLFSYPPWLEWLLLLLSAVLLSFAGIRSGRRGALDLPALLLGVGSAILVLASPLLLVFLLNRLLGPTLQPNEVSSRLGAWFAAWALLTGGVALGLQGLTRQGLSFRLGLLPPLLLAGLSIAGGANLTLTAVATASGAVLALLLRRPLAAEAQIAGGLWLLSILALAALLLLAGGAHVLLWPLFFAAIVQAWRWRRAGGEAAPLSWLVALLPAIWIFGNTAITFDLMAGFAIPVVPMVPLLLLLLLLAPLQGDLSRQKGLALALLGLVGLAFLAANPPWSEETPEPTSLFVLRDVDQQQTYWASEDQTLTPWHRGALGQEPQLASTALYQPNAAKKLWLTPLAGAEIAAPKVELLEADRAAGRLRLRIYPLSAGDAMDFWLGPRTKIRAWQVDGQPLQSDPNDAADWRRLSGFALDAAGVELALDLGPGEAWPEILLTGLHAGLPDGLALPPRNAAQKRRPNSYSDTTVVFRQLRIDELARGQATLVALGAPEAETKSKRKVGLCAM